MLKTFHLLGGFAPDLSDQGLCSWTMLGAHTQTPVIGSRSEIVMIVPRIRDLAGFSPTENNFSLRPC